MPTVPQVANPVPTLLIAGPPGSGKTALLRRWAQQIATGEQWTLILRTHDIRLPDEVHGDSKPSQAHFIQLAHDCACCSGQMVLKTHLARTLRMRRPDRLFIETGLDDHLAATLDWLNGPQWSGWIGPVRCLLLLPVSQPAQHDKVASGEWSDALELADVVCFDAGEAGSVPAPDLAALLLAARQRGGAAQWRIQAPVSRLEWPAVEQALGTDRRPV